MNYMARILPRSAVSECGQLDGARVWAYLIAGTLLACLIGSFFVPWTQNVSGEGRVIAYSPVERETPIRAPMDGRVVRWFVTEGDQVEAGQTIAEMSDNDPFRLERLGRSRDAVRAQKLAVQAAVRVAEEQVAALIEARNAALATAELDVRIARERREGKRQDLIAAQAKSATAAMNLARQKQLNGDDLSSDRDLELAELGNATAGAELDRARAALRAAEREVESAQTKLSEIGQKNRASIEKARGEMAKLQAESNKVEASVVKAETDVARQEQMLISAPRAGRILAMTARAGTEYVKAGQSLAVLVPDTEQRAVEIWVDGNDAPLIAPGRHARLQFEGWPAVQFVGWPSVAVGTFGGEVAFVDPAAGDDGRFRVVVVPDENGEPWPDSMYLRQGARARGWVLLNRVSVAFELWRQLNGFPPATQPRDSSLGKKGPASGGKRAK